MCDDQNLEPQPLSVLGSDGGRRDPHRAERPGHDARRARPARGVEPSHGLPGGRAVAHARL